MRLVRLRASLLTLASCALLAAACGPTSGDEPPGCEGPVTCSNHGACDDSTGDIVCTCDHGYTGALCELCDTGFVDNGGGLCGPVAPCLEGFCGGHGTCDDTTGYATCECDTGYAGANCENCDAAYMDYGDGECRPIDPCTTDPTCEDQNRECTADNGYAVCADCLEGYYEEGGACIMPCAAESIPGQLVPLDLYILLDHSSSMTDSGKWGAVTSAILSFVSAPDTVGIGVGLQYFPVDPSSPIPGTCTSAADCGLYGLCLPGFNVCAGSLSPDTSCDPADYATPQVAIAELPGVEPAITSSINGESADGSATPTEPAMQGAVTYTVAWAQANPTHLVYIVFASDGEPTGCTTNSVSGTASIAQSAANGNPSVKTFVIGVGTELTSLNQIAADGGTGQAYLVDTGGNVTQQFIDALNEIRANGDCMYQIPMPTQGTPDYDMINVNLVDPNDPNNPATVFYVGDEASCDPTTGGWYYDDPGDPQIILLCPATCDEVNLGDLDVEILVGCETIVG